MQNIYQVANSYYLREGLDSEFLVVAGSEEQAKVECLKLLAEDEPRHVAEVRRDLESLKLSLEKNLSRFDESDPSYAFIVKANERSRQNIVRLTQLLENFHGYKAEALTVRQLDPRLKNGHIQYFGETDEIML